MRLRDQYDWVVLGDSPGALLSACLAAKLGLSTLMVPLLPSQKVQASTSGLHLDPESNFLLGLGSLGHGKKEPGLVLECLKHLGILASDSDRIITESVEPQIAGPAYRVLLSSDRDRLNYELRREFGQETADRFGLANIAQAVELDYWNYWSAFPARLTLRPEKKSAPGPTTLSDLEGSLAKSDRVSRGENKAASEGWFSRKKASEVASRLGRQELHPLSSGAWYALSGSHATNDDPQMNELLNLLVLGRMGAAFRGGITGIRDLLIKLALKAGAHSTESHECRRIFIENGRFVGIQVASIGNMISAGGGVLGCSLSQVEDFITLSGKGLLRKLKAAPVPVGWKFTLALSVRDEAIPQAKGGMSTTSAMSRRLVWQEQGAPSLEFELADPSEYSEVPARKKGLKNLYLRTLLPFTQKSLDPGYQRLVAARMMRQATEVLPFLEYHVQDIYPDFRKSVDGPEKDELSEVFGFAAVEMIPENLRCFSGDGVGSSSGIEGLFVASGESFPKLGTFGSIVAGIESVAWLAHRAGLEGPLT